MTRTSTGDQPEPTPAADLAGLLDRVAARDRRAFSDLYAATSGRIFGVVVRILGRGGGAEEVLQEVYVTIWERAGQFDRAKGSPIGWMATVARNRALDAIRAGKRAPTMAFPEGFEPAGETEDPLASRERGEALRKLMTCLAALDEEKRKIILLAYYRGVSREELAKRFNRPEPTIKTWLRRGLEQLRICVSS